MRSSSGAARRLGALFFLLAAGQTLALLSCARHASKASASMAPPLSNVILITIDTLRADALGFSGSRKVETPNLDRLASEGLVEIRAI